MLFHCKTVDLTYPLVTLALSTVNHDDALHEANAQGVWLEGKVRQRGAEVLMKMSFLGNISFP